jgi:cell division septum initiation protein DivIVA
MSLAHSFFPSDTQEILHPQFSKALKGFSVEEVEDYVTQATRRIEVLESHLDRTLDERDHLRHELASVRSDVYRSAGERLAGILRSIDEHVDGIRRQAEDDAKRRITDAEQHAERMGQKAEDDAARTRAEAARVLQDAREEADRVLGALSGRRDELKAEIEGLRMVLNSALERLVLPSDEPVDEAAPEGISEPGPRVTVDGERFDHAEEGDWASEIDEAVVDLRDISVDEGS